MLLEGETVQSLLSVQKNTPVWASLAHNVLDFPGTSVSSSRRKLGRHPDTDAPESAVHMSMGDSGSAHNSMMEVEEETSVTDLGDNLHLPSTVGMDYTSTQDMEAEEAGSGGDMPGFSQASLITTHDSPSPLTIDWASLGQSEFDLPGTSVSASLSLPDTQLVINFETLGRGDVTMPGDNVGMEVETITGVQVPHHPEEPGNAALQDISAPRRRRNRPHVRSKSERAKRGANSTT